jgi:hypothetical protein
MTSRSSGGSPGSYEGQEAISVSDSVSVTRPTGVDSLSDPVEKCSLASEH